MVALSVVTFVALLVITAPYGRHTRAGWGPTISSTSGWVLMEAPASLGFLAFYLLGEHRAEAAPLALLALWQLHYANRAFVYPFRRRGGDKPMPLAVAALRRRLQPRQHLRSTRAGSSHFGAYPPGWLVSAPLPRRRRALPRRLRHQRRTPTKCCAPCARPASAATRSRTAACTASSRPPTTSASSSSGRASPSPPGRRPPWSSSSGPRPTWPLAPGPTTAGTGALSPTIRRRRRALVPFLF